MINGRSMGEAKTDLWTVPKLLQHYDSVGGYTARTERDRKETKSWEESLDSLFDRVVLLNQMVVDEVLDEILHDALKHIIDTAPAAVTRNMSDMLRHTVDESPTFVPLGM
jgi:hypothetical protein